MPVVYLAGLLVALFADRFTRCSLSVTLLSRRPNLIGRHPGSNPYGARGDAAINMEVPVRGSELQSYVMASDQPVTVDVRTIGGRGALRRTTR